MRIGKNELKIMELLDEADGLERGSLKNKFTLLGNRVTRFSEALKTLTEKELIAKYAQIEVEKRGWSFDSWTKDEDGNFAVLAKKLYDGKMAKGPKTRIYLELTEKGRKELRKREDRLSN
ncbi:hypothetical protein AKJ61_03385 [candidate division MSBL1 archaeon SCGC-AAA259B11]|uniref:ArnR1-like winged helix-turn-helix domain-containing protein n=1 Tax=candidate division MSBL1 archaeon SCGC-AAA259B11 TaxID=1698260 RepID=A0A133U4U9_9EURY|nr:hypothetical protein AKJ61_03385 [candidate division MSBL1 archaeon SCGC-AAA259B11]